MSDLPKSAHKRKKNSAVGKPTRNFKKSSERSFSRLPSKSMSKCRSAIVRPNAKKNCSESKKSSKRRRD